MKPCNKIVLMEHTVKNNQFLKCVCIQNNGKLRKMQVILEEFDVD